MQFIVENMKCGACSSNVQAKLVALDGVDSAVVDLATKTATVQGSVDPDLVIETLAEAGYPAGLAD